MGNWIPGDPTLVAQILRISAAYAPPPQGFVSPMCWGVQDHIVERFAAAGIAPDRVSCELDTYRFSTRRPPRELVDAFRAFYGPTMNAFEAADGAGRADELKRELDTLFDAQNTSPSPDTTAIAATFMRVTVLVA